MSTTGRRQSRLGSPRRLTTASTSAPNTPIVAALSRLGDQQAADLRRDVIDLAEEMNVSDGNALVLPLAYLEIVARKR